MFSCHYLLQQVVKNTSKVVVCIGLHWLGSVDIDTDIDYQDENHEPTQPMFCARIQADVYYNLLTNTPVYYVPLQAINDWSNMSALLLRMVLQVIWFDKSACEILLGQLCTA